MRFIDVTRYGGVKTLRLSVAAIAYVDTCEGGAVVRLIGGESLRVNEDCKTIEARVAEDEEPVSPPIVDEAPKTVVKASKGKRK